MRSLFGVFLVLAFAGPTGLAARAAPPPISIQVQPAVASWAQEIALERRILAAGPDEPVVVEERRCGSHGFLPVYTTRTLARGYWDLHWNALASSAYRVRWRGETSAAVEVSKRPGVTLSSPARNRYLVTVFAVRQFRGVHATLERFAPRERRWVAVRRFPLARSGASRTTVWAQGRVRAHVPRGTLLRVVVPATECYLRGFSNMLRTG